MQLSSFPPWHCGFQSLISVTTIRIAICGDATKTPWIVYLGCIDCQPHDMGCTRDKQSNVISYALFCGAQHFDLHTMSKRQSHLFPTYLRCLRVSSFSRDPSINAAVRDLYIKLNPFHCRPLRITSRFARRSSFACWLDSRGRAGGLARGNTLHFMPLIPTRGRTIIKRCRDCTCRILLSMQLFQYKIKVPGANTGKQHSQNQGKNMQHSLVQVNNLVQISSHRVKYTYPRHPWLNINKQYGEVRYKHLQRFIFYLTSPVSVY